RGARWSEFDLDGKEWRIPQERMKIKEGGDHIVPLTKQTIKLINELEPITGCYDLLFPGERRSTQPMSENTLLFMLYRMGYKGKATPHGFRATASSILNEQNFNSDAIERQLSHVERNKVKGAYNYNAEFMRERKKIMKWWSDYLDDMEKEKIVVAGNFKRKQ
ncbi:MAG: integrase, partial [Betaproteobacteria bacterium]